jgi:hypothetical protein
MDLLIRFDVLSDGITRGLLMGHMEGENYAAIINSSRLASVDLARGIVAGDLIGDGETWYFTDMPHPDIKIHSIDVFPQAVFVTNHPEM